jgi:hypothetical protein
MVRLVRRKCRTLPRVAADSHCAVAASALGSSRDARPKIRLGNCERLFDASRNSVRAWEAVHLK